MRVLLDTNIIIHREANVVVNPGIGKLFNWLDKLGQTKCVHPLTVEEIGRHADPRVVATMQIKIANYHLLKTFAPMKEAISQLSKLLDKNSNDVNDTRLLNEVLEGRVDMMISEDKNIHQKASALGISEKVYTIEQYLEKVTSENPDFVNYKTLAVKKEYFGNIDVSNDFFDSFRKDYQGFDRWFSKKSDEIAYVCYEGQQLMAFLYLKKENSTENYTDIQPNFSKKTRLKIGTFKVTLNGFKLGERFLKIIFDNAIQQHVDEIYVTLFDSSQDQQRLVGLLIEWGFEQWGTKKTSSGEEIVLVRNFQKVFEHSNPKISFPFISLQSSAFIVPIYPQYHTELFPDSILKTESPTDFIENEPHRNAISKVYVSRSYEKNLNPGDTIVFYRTGETHPKIYSSVVSTIGVVESVITNIKNKQEFIDLCRKRSVFSDEELAKHWDYSSVKPFIVNFLYTYSFPKRVILNELISLGVINGVSSVPRGFQKLTQEQLIKTLKAAKTDESIIVN